MTRLMNAAFRLFLTSEGVEKVGERCQRGTSYNPPRPYIDLGPREIFPACLDDRHVTGVEFRADNMSRWAVPGEYELSGAYNGVIVTINTEGESMSIVLAVSWETFVGSFDATLVFLVYPVLSLYAATS